MKFLSLFAGIGGFDLGLERAGMECVGQVENDPYCIRVLEKHWPDVKRWGDIKDVTAETLADAFRSNCHGRTNKPKRKTEGRTPVNGTSEDGATSGENSPHPAIELICGGFPCTPWSAAGKQRGTEDDRDLWPEMLRIIEIVRPRWVIGENVRGFVSMEMGLDRSISDLENAGYAVQAFIVGAVSVDAPHRRDRCWIIGSKNGTHPDLFRSHREGLDQHGEAEPIDGQEREPGSVREVLARRGDTEKRKTEDVADGESARRETRGGDGVGIADRPRRDKGQSPGSSSEAGAVADADRAGRQQQRGAKPAQAELPAAERGGDVADTTGGRREQRHENPRRGRAGSGEEQRARLGGGSRWLPESEMGQLVDGLSTGLAGWPGEPEGVPRVATGVRNRVDKLRALGNSVVPQIPEIIGRAILQTEEEVNED